MIFVVGAARSGTSLITRIIEQCGARLGRTNGLAENMSLKTKWTYPKLHERGFDRFGQKPIPKAAIRGMRPEVVRGEMQPLLEGVDCAKDVKLVHFWPVIAEAFPEAKWVIVWRDPKKIAASCMRTHFMKALTSLEQWEEWAETYHRRCRELQDAYPSRVFTVSVSDLHTNPEGLSGAVTASGLQWDEAAVDRVFDSAKWTG